MDINEEESTQINLNQFTDDIEDTELVYSILEGSGPEYGIIELNQNLITYIAEEMS